MNVLKKLTLTLGLVLGIGSSVLAASPAGAAVDVFGACGSGDTSHAICASKTDTAGSLTKTIISLLIYLTGIIAVIMIIIGGLRYVTSNGDSSGVTGAKNTILYAVVGLVVAILSYTIVKFVLNWI